MNQENGHEADLARLITGELEASSEAGHLALEAAGMSIEELIKLQELAQKLDHAAEFQELVKQEAEQLEAAPGVEQVAGVIDDLAGSPQPRRRPWLLPAAGLLLLLPLALQLFDKKSEVLLGDDPVVVRFLQEPDGAYPPIEYAVQDEYKIGEHYLMVYDAEDAIRVTPLFEYRLDQSPWSNPEEQSKWPDSVHLVVEVRVPGQSTGVSGWVEGSRD